MKFDTTILSPKLSEMVEYTRSAEEIGFDGIWVGETGSNPFLPLTLAAEHSRRVSLGTAIAVAFPRSPTILAHIAWDLAGYSNGRFILGLGPQVRAHNERRLGVKWDRPVQKMQETIEAMRAVWDCWQHGSRLDYEGEFFQLNLMTPFFSGQPLDVPPPPVYVSAINQKMLQLAGRICDGAHLHVLHTVKYLQELAWPTIIKGLEESGRTREDFTAVAAVFAIPTDGRKPAGHYESFVKSQLSFYMSTPSYRTVLELHGWEETGWRLSKLARKGAWDEMSGLITDEILDAFAVSGTWGRLPQIIQARYGDLLDRAGYYLPFVPGEEDAGWEATVAGFKELLGIQGC